MKKINNYKHAVTSKYQKSQIILISIVTGLLAGLVSNAYRYLLSKAETFSFEMYSYFRVHPKLIPVLLVILLAMGFITALLVKYIPFINGSGIPQVKGIISGNIEHNWLRTISGKFAGGILAIAAGLSLGREGPSIQLGASIAEGIADKFARTRFEKKVLIASGAGAGLSAAFNAPLAGALFTLEEIYKYFSPLVCISAMAAAVAGDYTAGLLFGTKPIFQFGAISQIPLTHYWYILLLGLFLGALGVFYNKSLLFTQNIFKKYFQFMGSFKIMIPFAFAGLLGIYYPFALGGGHVLLEKIDIRTGIAALLVAFMIKLLFSIISFGSGAPGGIFFPFLIIGSLAGAIAGKIFIQIGLPSDCVYTIVILSMCGFFSAIVRAPFTGIILLSEMTGSFTTLLPLTMISIISYFTADLLRGEPIYDSLLRILIHNTDCDVLTEDNSRKVTFEVVIHHGSYAEGKQVKELDLPDNCLLIAVNRDNREFIPKGNTLLTPGDLLVLLTDVDEEPLVRQHLFSLMEVPEV